MEKKALHKDFYREIRKSRGRFLSIFFIVALGVAFFSGIRSAEPDMRHTGDVYFDASNLMDIKVVGTMGLTNKDLDAVRNVEGVVKAEAGYSADILYRENDESRKVLHVMSLLPSMNHITVSEGRLPKQAGECLVDEDFMKDSSYRIGDTIMLEPGGEGKLKDTFWTDRLTIVGTGNSPCYISFGRGSSTIGNGKVNGFVVTTADTFSMDVYTEIYVQAEGAKEKTAFTGAYEKIVDRVLDHVDDISAGRCEARRAGIVAEAQAEIKEAEQDYNREKEKADKELRKAKEKLKDGEAALTKAKRKITDGKKELKRARNQLAAKQTELDAGRQQYQTGLVKIRKAEQQLSKEETDFQETYQAGMAGIKKGEQEVREGRKQLDAAWQQYERYPDKTAPEAEALKAELEAKQNVLDETEAALKINKQKLKEGQAALKTADQELHSNKDVLAATKTKLDDAQTQLDRARSQLKEKERELEKAEAQVQKSEQEITDGKRQYEDAKNEAEAELADGKKKIDDAKEEVESIALPKWYVTDRAALPEYSGYGENADRMGAIGRVFPVVFFLVAALISLTTMTRMVEEQRTQIGTLKALGYGKGSIAFKYTSYALLATAGGSVTGVLIGEKVLPYIIIYAYGIMYQHMPDILVPYNWYYAVLASAAALLCTLGATLISCYKELASDPASLMRPPAPKIGKRIFLERITILWKHLSFIWKSTVRNLFRYKKRFFMTVLGIGGCMGLMLVGFGLKDSILEIADLQYGEIQHYDGAVYLSDEITKDQKTAVLSGIDEDSDIDRYTEVKMKNTGIQKGSVEKEVYLCVPRDAAGMEQFIGFRDRDTKEQYHLGDDGAILTEKMAKTLDVKTGDIVIVDGKEIRIADICENYMWHYLYLSPELYKETFKEEPDYNSILFGMEHYSEKQLLETGEKILSQEGVLNISYTNSIHEQLDDMLGSLNLVIVVLIVSAGMLAFVVLYNLNNINITERQRELATIKVLGFYDNEVGAYVYRENILLTLIGTLVGMGVGRILHRFIIVTVEVESAMFGRNINAASYLYSFLFTVGFALIVNVAMYYKLKKIDMVESLKSVE